MSALTEIFAERIDLPGGGHADVLIEDGEEVTNRRSVTKSPEEYARASVRIRRQYLAEKYGWGPILASKPIDKIIGTGQPRGDHHTENARKFAQQIGDGLRAAWGIDEPEQYDAEFEGKHPRDDGGKFGSGGGAAAEEPPKTIKARKQPPHMERISVKDEFRPSRGTLDVPFGINIKLDQVRAMMDDTMHTEIKGVFDEESGDVYWWDGDIMTHSSVRKSLGLPAAGINISAINDKHLDAIFSSFLFVKGGHRNVYEGRPQPEYYAAGWNESDHPRADDGKFGQGGGAALGPGNRLSEPLEADNRITAPLEPGARISGAFETPAAQYERMGTRAANFLGWFGNWQRGEGSKVVDEKGEPQAQHEMSHVRDKTGRPVRVYHGKPGGKIEAMNKKYLDDNALFGPGMYFTEDESVATEYQEKGRPWGKFTGDREQLAARVIDLSQYFAGQIHGLGAAAQLGQASKRLREDKSDWTSNQDDPTTQALVGLLPERDLDKFWEKSDATVLEVYLNIRQPLDGDNATIKRSDLGIPEGALASGDQARTYQGWKGYLEHFEQVDPERFRKLTGGVPRGQWLNGQFAKLGYDGITHVGGQMMGDREHRVWIAFEPEQIKSVGNKGTFDPADKRMDYAAGWNESDHPRADDGKFGQGGGEGKKLDLSKRHERREMERLTDTDLKTLEIESTDGRTQRLARRIKNERKPLTTEQQSAMDKAAAESRKKSESLRAGERVQRQRLEGSLSPEEYQQADIRGLLDQRTPRQLKQYVDAAISWQAHNPSAKGIEYAVSELASRGIQMEQKGNNYSWYGTAPGEMSVRVGNHLGFDAHDIDIVMDIDSPPTKQSAIETVKDELEGLAGSDEERQQYDAEFEGKHPRDDGGQFGQGGGGTSVAEPPTNPHQSPPIPTNRQKSPPDSPISNKPTTPEPTADDQIGEWATEKPKRIRRGPKHPSESPADLFNRQLDDVYTLYTQMAGLLGRNIDDVLSPGDAYKLALELGASEAVAQWAATPEGGEDPLRFGEFIKGLQHVVRAERNDEVFEHAQEMMGNATSALFQAPGAHDLYIHPSVRKPDRPHGHAGDVGNWQLSEFVKGSSGGYIRTGTPRPPRAPGKPLGQDSIPTGHHTFDTKDDAIRAATGTVTKGWNDMGSLQHKVTWTNTSGQPAPFALEHWREAMKYQRTPFEAITGEQRNLTLVELLSAEFARIGFPRQTQRHYGADFEADHPRSDDGKFGTMDLTGWDKKQEQTKSLAGQKSLFGDVHATDVGKTAKTRRKRESDRQQTKLFQAANDG